MGLKIVIVGTVDMPETWQKKFDIHILPLNIRFGAQIYVQGKDIDRDGFNKKIQETRTILPLSSREAKLPGNIGYQSFDFRCGKSGSPSRRNRCISSLSG